jgi:MFS family permease
VSADAQVGIPAVGAGTGKAAGAAGIVLMTLAAGQFVMALDTTVMNTAIATVAKDVGTTVTGIQTAITTYTLVMASLMITGGKVGQMIGRKRAFAIGCIIYACGSLITALAQNLTVLMIGWSGLEGLGAVLIMPAIVALVASNFAKPDRPRAYGLVAAAGAIAAALGPLIGGIFTTYASWRWVFVGEVAIVLVILILTRRINDTPAEEGARLDLMGTALSALGLGAIVLGILKAGTWGLVQPKPDAPEWFGLSPVIWMIFAGAAVLVLFVSWENRRITHGQSALIDPAMLRNLQLRNGVASFFFMYLIQAGIFFTVPLFLSVALGISAVETGVRLLPLSLSLLLFAVGVPKLRPNASPRRVVRLGFIMLFAGLVLLVALLDAGVGPEIVTWPLLLAGSGLGMLASQLGAVTVSSVPDEQSGEVGGLQNTGTQLGASIGTALAGAVLISAITASFFTGIENNPKVPDSVVSQAHTQLAGGVPFSSEPDTKAALKKANVPSATADEIGKQNEKSQIDGLRAAEAILALLALVALPFTRGIPTVQPGAQAKPKPSPSKPTSRVPELRSPRLGNKGYVELRGERAVESGDLLG